MARKAETTPKKKTVKRVSAPRAARPAASKAKIKKPIKPVFSTGTLVMLAVLALFVAGIFYLKNKDQADAEATPTTEAAAYAFNISEAGISSIEVKTIDDESVKIERPEGGAWKLTLPVEAEANQGLAEAAASQAANVFVNGKVNNSSDLSIFGLKEPAYIITIVSTDKTKHTLEIGETTPTENGYYARVDGKDVVILETSSVEALTALVSNPPYLSTPTPTSLPPTATPELPTATEAPAEAESTATPAQ